MFKKIGKILLIIVLIGFLAVIGYIGYMQINYYRIEDGQKLEIHNQQEAMIEQGKEYSAVTYNIGFGAYNHDFSFFMDKGVMKDGTEVQGTMSRGQSKEEVMENTNGSMDEMEQLDADFILLQEVDTDAIRSYQINQKIMFEEAFKDYASDFAINFHSAYLVYPFSEPHGAVEAGLLSLSKYHIDEAMRGSYPVTDAFFAKFFDLDRCYVINRMKVENGKELVLINSHMSAYDEGGTIRQEQLSLLNKVMEEEYEKGNYVIVGGDFNHALLGTEEVFPSQQEVPSWVFSLSNEDVIEGMAIVRADNIMEVSTIRSTDIPYEKGVNYESVLDGFIVSDNIDATAVNVDANYNYSDHNPVKLTFTLKK